MVRRVAVLALVTVAAAGCGHSKVAHFGDLRVTKAGPVKLETSPPPPFPGGPARNIADVEFLTPRIGFLTSSNGQFDREPGRIQRTGDGGRTWHDVWTGRGTHLGWIAFADRRHGFVGGDRFILRTSDGGATWRRSPMSMPKRVRSWSWWMVEPQFVTSTLGFAVTDRASFYGPVFLRTTDGGRRWRPIRGLQDVRDVDFVSSRTGFALGTKLYRTDDGGVTWRALDLPHVPYSLAAVDFLDTRHGFVAGGQVAMTEQPPAQTVFATSDGGHTWERRYENPHRGYSPQGGDPFARLHFVDARRGWATTGLCKCCPNGPCVGGVYVTRDGGHSWKRRGEGAQLTTIGADDAWTTPGCDVECDLLWRTTDAGRTWRPIARPDRINFSSVAVRGAAPGLTSYDDASFVSRDHGRTWRLGTLAAPVARAEIRARFYADEACGGSVPFVEAGRAIHLTYDSGRTWKVLRPPFATASVAVEPDLLAAVGVRDCLPVLALSRSRGRSWAISKIPRACEPAVARDAEVWLWCERLLLHSVDRGRTWSRLRAPSPIMSVAATGAGNAWIVSGNGVMGRLWRTADGGKTWRQAWPRLPTRG